MFPRHVTIRSNPVCPSAGATPSLDRRLIICTGCAGITKKIRTEKNKSHVRLDALTVQTKVLDLYFDDEPGAQFGRVAASVGNVRKINPLHARTAQGGKLK